MLESDDRLFSFSSVDSARSVLADATSLDSLTYYDNFPTSRMNPTLANTIQALIIYEFIYGDCLLFDKQAGFSTAEKLFPGVVRRLFIHPDLRSEIARDMEKLREHVYFDYTDDLEDSETKRLLNAEEAQEKPLLDDLSDLPAVTRVPPDFVGDERLEMWASRRKPLLAEFPLGVLTSSFTLERAFWYLRLSQEVGLPLAASPARSAYFKPLLQNMKKKLMTSEAEQILQMFDKTVVTAARLKKWQQEGIEVEEIKIPPVADYVVRIAWEKNMSLVNAIREVRASPHAREFRELCGDMQRLSLSRSRAGLLARERALRKLKELGLRWAKNLGPTTNDRVRTLSICTLANFMTRIPHGANFCGICGSLKVCRKVKSALNMSIPPPSTLFTA